VFIIHPNNIKAIHNGRDKDKFIVICLVLVKIYGNIPKKLLNKINKNNEIKINVDPLNELGPINSLNSL